ncbi:hypothetical protein AWB74_00906 [Caballeronia arvi]|uniref:Uncharacterized protein n=1 Tax=Caballeronia arvi TaxID=1777135 RepID=A0A158FSP5_9BURK|nr:hypothetical protein AWB74_00906 [Caballeronia arvi]
MDWDVKRVPDSFSADPPLRAARGIFIRFGRTPHDMHRFVKFAQFAARHALRDFACTDAP